MKNLALIEVRKALPEDFKLPGDILKLGQPYFIVDKDNHVLYHYVMTADVDLEIFAEYLKKDMIRVPIEDQKIKAHLRKH